MNERITTEEGVCGFFILSGRIEVHITGSKGDVYVVTSKVGSGVYGCACPAAKFRREPCKHVNAAKAFLSRMLPPFLIS